MWNPRDDMIVLKGPERDFVTLSRKLKRRVQSLRRYAWDVRQLLQGLGQNQFGVVSTAAREMMETVETNASNMVEVSQGNAPHLQLPLPRPALWAPPYGRRPLRDQHLQFADIASRACPVSSCLVHVWSFPCLQRTWSSVKISSRYLIRTKSSSSAISCTCSRSQL